MPVKTGTALPAAACCLLPVACCQLRAAAKRRPRAPLGPGSSNTRTATHVQHHIELPFYNPNRPVSGVCESSTAPRMPQRGGQRAPEMHAQGGAVAARSDSAQERRSRGASSELPRLPRSSMLLVSVRSTQASSCCQMTPPPPAPAPSSAGKAHAPHGRTPCRSPLAAAAGQNGANGAKTWLLLLPRCKRAARPLFPLCPCTARRSSLACGPMPL